MSGCGCNSVFVLATGGAVLSGSALVSDNITRATGGCVVGGGSATGVSGGPSAIVEIVGDVWDSFEAVWPLDGSYNGTENEVTDVTRHQLHGTALGFPTQTTGVYCLGAQEFVGEEYDYIDLPQDGLLSSQPFTVSLWYRPNELYSPRAIFTRGNRIDGGEWVFNLSTSFINNVIASIQMTGDIFYECHSEAMLDVGRWHHIAATWSNGALSVYVNGVLSGTTAITESSTVALTTGSNLGKWNEGGFPTATMMEVRLSPVARTPAWLLAEYNNFCTASFVEFGNEQSPIY